MAKEVGKQIDPQKQNPYKFTSWATDYIWIIYLACSAQIIRVNGSRIVNIKIKHPSCLCNENVLRSNSYADSLPP